MKAPRIFPTLEALRREERGQIVLVAAAALVVVIGFTALAIDLGFVTYARREAQNDADAMALAAARELPDQAQAQDIAYLWAEKNDVPTAEVIGVSFGVTCSGRAVENAVTVRLRRRQTTFFAGVFGVGSRDVNVCATARVGIAEAGDELMPFGFFEEDPFGTADDPNNPDVCHMKEAGGAPNPALWGQPCLIKIAKEGANQWTGGNAGPVRMDEGEPSGANNYDGDCNVDGSGASFYEDNIKHGSECYYAKNDELRPKPGNMPGPTCSAFNDKIGANTDTLSDVFGGLENGVYTVVNKSSPRFALLPITTVSSNGSSTTITIKGFITVYVKEWCGNLSSPTGDSDCDSNNNGGGQGKGKGGGNGGNGAQKACVVVIPVRSTIYEAGVPIAGGSLNDSSTALRTIKLIE